MELIAVELRHLQRTEVGEVEEGFAAGQKGSSAMPHKRNPISAETISGLSRVLRGNLQAGLQDVALWHERDISHSSAERVVLPDSMLALDYMLDRFTWLVEGFEVNEDRMLSNIEQQRGTVSSQRVLLALVEAGEPRDQAYRMVQRAADAVRVGQHADLASALRSQEDVVRLVDGEQLSTLCAARAHDAGVAATFERLPRA